MDRLSHDDSFNLMLNAVDQAQISAKAVQQCETAYTYNVGKHWYAGISGRIEVRAYTENAALGKLQNEGYRWTTLNGKSL